MKLQQTNACWMRYSKWGEYTYRINTTDEPKCDKTQISSQKSRWWKKVVEPAESGLARSEFWLDTYCRGRGRAHLPSPHLRQKCVSADSSDDDRSVLSHYLKLTLDAQIQPTSDWNTTPVQDISADKNPPCTRLGAFQIQTKSGYALSGVGVNARALCCNTNHHTWVTRSATWSALGGPLRSSRPPGQHWGFLRDGRRACAGKNETTVSAHSCAGRLRLCVSESGSDEVHIFLLITFLRYEKNVGFTCYLLNLYWNIK